MTLPALLLALCTPVAGDDGAKLSLDPASVYDLTGRGLATRLIDEQQVAGDPRAGAGGAPSEGYNLGWQGKDLHFPARAVIDLGRPHQLTGAAWFDTNGSGPFSVSGFDPAAIDEPGRGWTPFLTDELKQFNVWTVRPAAVRTRYVMVTVGSPGGSVAEIVLYGRPAGEAEPPRPAPTPRRALKPPAFDRFLGVNGFVDDPVEKLAPVAGTVREYHSWKWDMLKAGAANEQVAFSPSAVRNDSVSWAWDFDDYYRRLNAAGATPAPVMQGAAPAAFLSDAAGPLPDGQDKPVPAGRDAERPASYREHAAHLFQYAARYGGRQVSDELLRTEAGQRVSGLGLVGGVENWNEPDAWWAGREVYFNPWELAAMSSADYDGHRGALGAGHGVKAADPEFQLVLGGLAGVNLESLRAIKLWADLYRGGSFPADAIAVHHYSRATDAAGREIGPGLPPEVDGLREIVAEVAAWRDAHLPGVELHVGEFGYDTHPASPQRAIAVGRFSVEQTQGIWLVRSALELAASGADRAQIYMLRDVNSDSGTKYATCGLTGTKENGHPPKPSWFHVATARATLAGLSYDGELNDDRVRGLWFSGQDEAGAARRVLVVWSPTAEDRRVPDWAPPGPAPTTLVRLRDDAPTGRQEPWPGQLTVTESPVFLQW